MNILDSLVGRNVLVVGGARGMGAAIATGFGRVGANVAIMDRLPGDARGSATATPMFDVDIASRVAVGTAFAALDEHFSQLDVVVNTVGITGTAAAAAEIEAADWQSVMAVNLSGHFWVAQQAALRMFQHGHGSIIGFASVSAYRTGRTPPHHAHYDASKAGLVSLGRALAQEWGPRGIRVNVISPGTHTTEIVREMFDFDESRLEAHLAKARRDIPIGRVAAADDIVPLTLLLASDAASNITGVDISSDGGRGIGFD